MSHADRVNLHRAVGRSVQSDAARSLGPAAPVHGCVSSLRQCQPGVSPSLTPGFHGVRARGNSPRLKAMSPRPRTDLTSQKSHMREEISAEEAAEERRLWADYYEATARALEIMRSEGTTTATLPRIAAEDARAAAAIARIKAIRGIEA
jgi:hypothetical protein